ncbi:translation initiation factor [Antarcticibacterium flavum]|uniref:Translation initiation factor n=1 Tax=Antarcticibacterium flavum TaxID=2058175 RepID=A0A5B7WY42_9FLAO|nr:MULTISPECIES: translation initiation factor [Antarcticibacterium]MCM4158865.1 translation initiation factor [Antarcticibacterium sp. W02-3]QCY68124.1 translation initiation factor [Antarcticibacterium flavum]
MGRKKLGLEDLGGLVFSTNNNFNPENDPGEEIQTPPPGEQRLEAHFSSKGRGGKTVTVIKGFEGNEEDLQKLGKDLKKKCGVGGSVKDGEIIIQGDVREKVMQLLINDGYKVKRVGG